MPRGKPGGLCPLCRCLLGSYGFSVFSVFLEYWHMRWGRKEPWTSWPWTMKEPGWDHLPDLSLPALSSGPFDYVSCSSDSESWCFVSTNWNILSTFCHLCLSFKVQVLPLLQVLSYYSSPNGSIIEEWVGYSGTNGGQAVPCTENVVNENTRAGECRTCRKLSGGSVCLEPSVCEKQWKHTLERKVRDGIGRLLDTGIRTLLCRQCSTIEEFWAEDWQPQN